MARPRTRDNSPDVLWTGKLVCLVRYKPEITNGEYHSGYVAFKEYHPANYAANPNEIKSFRDYSRGWWRTIPNTTSGDHIITREDRLNPEKLARFIAEAMAFDSQYLARNDAEIRAAQDVEAKRKAEQVNKESEYRAQVLEAREFLRLLEHFEHSTDSRVYRFAVLARAFNDCGAESGFGVARIVETREWPHQKMQTFYCAACSGKHGIVIMRKGMV